MRADERGDYGKMDCVGEVGDGERKGMRDMNTVRGFVG